MRLQETTFLVCMACRVSEQMLGMATKRKSPSGMYSDGERGMRKPETITARKPVQQMQVEDAVRRRWMYFWVAYV